MLIISNKNKNIYYKKIIHSNPHEQQDQVLNHEGHRMKYIIHAVTNKLFQVWNKGWKVVLDTIIFFQWSVVLIYFKSFS